MKEHVADLAMNNTGIRDTARALHISINEVVGVLKSTQLVGRGSVSISGRV